MATDDAPPLYLQIAEQLAQLIRNGTLARGEKLPSVRELARQHGVAQTTVVQAYHWLEDARLITARPRSGFFVAARPVSLPEPSTPRPLRRPREVSVDWLGQRILGHKQPEDIISFSSGTPGPELFNPDRVRRAVVRAAQRHRNLLCTYPSSSGHEDARRALARYAVGLGCSLDPENIVITGGCMDSIALCLRAVTQPGDVVALESPTHFSFLEVLQGLHLKALEIPTHPRNGLSLDALQLALDTQPVKAVMIVPTLSNPLGSCMPQAERKRLAQMAARHGLAVIEDAIYNDLVEVDDMRRTVKSYDTTGHVMLCDSFSKTLAPGLRLGWLEAGRWADKLRGRQGPAGRWPVGRAGAGSGRPYHPGRPRRRHAPAARGRSGAHGRGAPNHRRALPARHARERPARRPAAMAGAATRARFGATARGLPGPADPDRARHGVQRQRAISQLPAHWGGG